MSKTNSKWVQDKEDRLTKLEEVVPLLARNVIIDTEENLQRYVDLKLVHPGALLVATSKK